MAALSPSVIVAGATGAIGREFVQQAVSDNFFARVVALSRKDIPEAQWEETWPGIDLTKARNKLKVYAVDWEALCENPANAKAAEAFSGHQYAVNLLGSTRKDAGSAENFHHYDFDYYEAFANAVKAFNPNPAVSSNSNEALSSLQHFAQISSTGASSSSWFLYPKTKGEADESLMRKGYFAKASIWRPGLLGRKDKARTVEKFASFFVSAMDVGQVAAAIIATMKSPSAFASNGEVGKYKDSSPNSDIRLFHNDDIRKLTPEWKAKHDEEKHDQKKSDL